VRDLIGASDGHAAYRVQSLVAAARVERGATVVGRKIGLTSAAVQRQLGVDQPDFGVLFDDMAYVGGDVIPMSRLMQPKVEAEVAFFLQKDLTEGDYGASTVKSAVAYAAPALEVVDSRIDAWDITFSDTVADNASSGLFVIGPERRTLDDVEPVNVSMRMTADGEVVSTGRGDACLGDPLNALAWLANKAVELGDPLLAGHLVLSGALGPMHQVRAGSIVRADLTGLGAVAVAFADDTDEEGR
jgi:2-keto-4-pentenoate hydratase